MKVLLVEPDYRRGSQSFRNKIDNSDKKWDDESLWYPPLGLMKLATFHKQRGDSVSFVNGCDRSVIQEGDLFDPEMLWDRVYITTLFTFGWNEVIKTIEFYKKAVGGSSHKVYVGGIMASLMPHEIYEETGIAPVKGMLWSSEQIGLDDDVNIDLLPPDYDILSKRYYAIKDTMYAYTTRGCINKCQWCGVPEIEGGLQDYVDIKSSVNYVNEHFTEKSRLKLMDNNVLASKNLEKIVDDLLELGFARNSYTASTPKRLKVVDFNQGLDSEWVTDETMKLISKLNVKPFRIAFDRLSEEKKYVNAVQLAHKYGIKEFSNYMLFNFKDKPKDLYDRILVNIKLNKQFVENGKSNGAIYSYPMRFAPIRDLEIKKKKNTYGVDSGAGIVSREHVEKDVKLLSNYVKDAQWTPKFLRNIEVIKAATHGTISPTPALALRAVGRNLDQFIANLYMPEEMLRYRDKYEATEYPGEKIREKKGTGDVDDFYVFIKRYAHNPSDDFIKFHNAITSNSTSVIRAYFDGCNNEEYKKWEEFYLKK